MRAKEFCDRYYVERRGTDCSKWDALEKNYGSKDLISLWVADMDFKAPDCVREALAARVEHGAFGYSMIPDDYYEPFIQWEQTHHDLTISPEWIRFTPGVVSALFWCVQAFSEKGDAVIMHMPVYYPFHHAAEDVGRKLVGCDLINTDGVYSIDFQGFEEKIIKNNVKIFIQCSPHNPVGRVWTEQELDRLFDICLSHNVLIISDEIHHDILPGSRAHIPAFNVSGGKYRDNIILAAAPSKTFNLAGCQNSTLLIPCAEKRRIFDEFSVYPKVQEGNVFGYIAARAAYSGGAQWLEGAVDLIRENYRTLLSILDKAPDVRVSPLEGTYLAWLDFNRCVPPEKLVPLIQEQCGLAVDFGDWFGSCGRGFVRLNLATHPRFVHEAAERIVSALSAG